MKKLSKAQTEILSKLALPHYYLWEYENHPQRIALVKFLTKNTVIIEKKLPSATMNALDGGTFGETPFYINDNVKWDYGILYQISNLGKRYLKEI